MRHICRIYKIFLYLQNNIYNNLKHKKMKKKITKIGLAALMVVAISLVTTSGCKKSKVQGCMDQDSYNYNSSAEEDDGSCKYKAGVVFWLTQSSSASLVSYGASTVTFKVNGTIIGSCAANVYSTSAPSCTGGAAHATYDLGTSKTKAFTYELNADCPTGSFTGGDTVITETGTFTLNAHNSCLSVEL